MTPQEKYLADSDVIKATIDMIDRLPTYENNEMYNPIYVDKARREVLANAKKVILSLHVAAKENGSQSLINQYHGLCDEIKCHKDHVEAMQKREEALVKDNKELINKLLIAGIALEYYADKDSYDDNNAPYSHLPDKPWIPIADCGNVAIAALKSIKE